MASFVVFAGRSVSRKFEEQPLAAAVQYRLEVNAFDLLNFSRRRFLTSYIA